MIDLFKGFFKGKNVLITGHTGFKGSWLSLWLVELGANVIGYALQPENQTDNYMLCGLDKDVKSIIADIRSKDDLKSVFKKHNPEIVFHLAAQPIVSEGYRDIYNTYDINIMGTLNVLEKIKETESVKLGIMITSDKCYKNKEWVYGYRENDELGGDDPYSSSKACAELLVASYRKSYLDSQDFEKHNKLILTARSGNVIGGGDWSENRIIPDCIRALEQKEKIIIRNPNAIRPWQHVLEPISGYLKLASKSIELHPTLYADAWNFGPDFSNIVPVETLVKKVMKNWGNGDYQINSPSKEKMHETSILNLDSTRSKNYLKWKPVWDIDATIVQTIEWYKNYHSKNVRKMSLKQIETYCKECTL